MDQLTPEEMAKLPKWAQRHLEVCYNHINSLARAKAAWFRTPPAQARIVLSHFHGANGTDDDDQPLQRHQRIKFYLTEEHHRWQNYIEIGLDLNHPDRINVQASGSIAVLPTAYNCCAIKLDKD